MNSQLASSNDMFQIRLARVDDAPSVYNLIAQGFGDRYLTYTIYQAPESVAYLRQLIANPSSAMQRTLYVLEQVGRLVGYYEAMQRGIEFWLNYVVVDTAVRRRGIGQALLEHFEHTAQQFHCQRLVLDVFDSNQPARDWYYLQGYQHQSATFQIRLSTSMLDDASVHPLTYSDESWHNACDEERSRGFSKVESGCGPGRITVGLIGGRVCKLLEYVGVDLEDAVAAVCRHFHNTRSELILTALEAIPIHWPVLSAEKTLRLVKPLTSVG